jgi:hypothetical protein
MLKALRHHPVMVGMVELLADAVRYVTIILTPAARQLAKVAL